MKNGKICFLAPDAYPLFNNSVEPTFGGAEVQMVLFAGEYVKNPKLDISFIVADFGQAELEIHNSIKVWRSLNEQKSIFSQIFAFHKAFSKVNASVYIQYSLSKFSGPLAFYCWLRRKRFVYMLANDGESDLTHPGYRSRSSRFLSGLVFKFSSLIISQNDYQQKNITKNFHCDSKIISAVGKTSLHTNQTREHILWVSRMDKNYKQPEIFIELAGTFPNEKFVIIGPPAQDQREYFEEIKNLSVKYKNVRYLDFVPYNQIDQYFQGAKIFVNTSSSEGFPNTFIQAAKNKTPILSLSVNPDDVLNKYSIGLFCNNNPDELKLNLKKLLEDKKLYDQLAGNALKYFEEHHDLVKNAQIFLSYIINL